MQCTISRDGFITALEWVLLIGLCIVSGFFSSGVVEQYLSGKTSFTQYEEPITNHPAIVIRFSLKPSEVNFSDINISYIASGLGLKRLEKNLSLGKNYFLHPEGVNKTTVVYLESFVTFQPGDTLKTKLRAFRIINVSPLTYNNKGIGGAKIKVYHHLRKSKSWQNDQILFTLTSIKNSPGVRRIWKDGKPLHFIVSKNTYTRIELEAEEYRFLEQKGECQQESFYECFGSELESSDDFKRCSKKCIPKVFSNMGKNYSTPFCQGFSGEGCVKKIVKGLIRSTDQRCKKSCSRLQYLGQIAENHPNHPSDASDHCGVITSSVTTRS